MLLSMLLATSKQLIYWIIVSGQPLRGGNLCQACWSAVHYARALTMLHEGMAKAQERKNTFIVGRLTNTLGWFCQEFGAVYRAIELDHESIELGAGLWHFQCGDQRCD